MMEQLYLSIYSFICEYWPEFLLVIFIGKFDRIKEICKFRSWFNGSILFDFPSGIKRWLNGDRPYIRVFFKYGKIVIKTHPWIEDGYHHFKNNEVIALLVYLGFKYDYWFFLVTPIVWWMVQKLTYWLIVRYE